MIEDILGKPATHAAWSPFFDEHGNFVEWVQVGRGFLEAGQQRQRQFSEDTSIQPRHHL
jgi:hypothetical protein